MKIFEALAEGNGILEQEGIGNSRQDVEALLRDTSRQVPFPQYYEATDFVESTLVA